MPTYYPIHPLPFPIMNPDTGNAASGFTLEAYLAGTSTPTNMYSDDAGTVIGTTLSINSKGYPINGASSVVSIFLETGLDYDFILRDEESNQEWAISGINGIPRQSTTVADYTAARALDSSTLADRQRIWINGFAYSWEVKTGTVTDNGWHLVFNDDSNRYAESTSLVVSVDIFGAVGDGVANDTASCLAAEAQGDRIYVGSGTYLVDAGQIDYSKYYGEGLFRIGSQTFPAGDIKTATTIADVISTFGYKACFSDYLPYRRILAPLTISIPAGTHNIDMTDGVNVRYEHVDGSMITIQGASAATTTLLFDFTGQSGNRLYGLGLDGNYNLKFVDGITFDGDNYSGHADGGPTLGDGLGNDPIGLKVQNSAAIECSSDVVFQNFARNGVFANEGAYALVNGVDVNNCGSDAYVASLGASVRAEGSSCSEIYGDAYYADFGGKVFCKGSVADDIRTRFSGSAGDGLVAIQGGHIYGEDAALTNIADVGILGLNGGEIFGDDITVGGVGVGCGGYGLHLTCSTFSGARLDVQYSGSDGLRVENASTLSSDGCVSSNNAGDGLDCTESSSSLVTTGSFDSNGGSGINCSNSFVHAASLTSIDLNTGWGIISRRSGIVNSDGTTIGASNGSGAASPAVDTSTGIADSYIYT
jgi:hypothetical protein